MLKHGDRAGAIYRIDDRRRIVVVAGYGTYAGEDRGEGKLMLGFKDSTIMADDGGDIDVNYCYAWGAETTIQKIIDEYKNELRYRVMNVEDFKKEPEAKRVRFVY